MTNRIDLVAEGIYRICAFDPQIGISFNQFLIDDERPTLIHTGTHPAYEAIRSTIAKVLDPARLAYVVVPHFEADECGGMGRFVKDAPRSTLICSEAGAMLNFSAWDYAGPFKGMRDGDALELGKHRLKFWETPHVHHWDSMMVFEESTRSLFPADLYIQPGEQPTFVRENLGQAMCQLYREAGIFAAPKPVQNVVDRTEKISPNLIHPMHGGSLQRESIAYYLSALRTTPFCYEGKLFGRLLPT